MLYFNLGRNVRGASAVASTPQVPRWMCSWSWPRPVEDDRDRGSRRKFASLGEDVVGGGLSALLVFQLGEPELEGLLAGVLAVAVAVAEIGPLVPDEGFLDPLDLL